MKKTVALMIVTLAVAMFFTACTKDGQYMPKKKISKIVYTQSSKVEGLTVSTTQSEKWTWGGDLLSLIDYYDNAGDRVRTEVFRYDADNRLEEMEDATHNVKYTYNNDNRLEVIEVREVATGKLVSKMELGYKGSKLATIDVTSNEEKGVKSVAFNPLRFFVPENAAEVVMSTPATKGSTVRYMLTWTGNNITEMTSEPFGYSVKWTYDDKINPFKGFLNLNDLTVSQTHSKNNIVRQEYVAQGNKIVRDFTINYDGNYPIKTKYQAESSTFVPGVSLMVDYEAEYTY